MVKVFGKQTFFSQKKNQDFYILHVCYKKDGVEGFAVDQKFVSSEIYSKVQVNKDYEIIYGAYDNGRAFISDVKEALH